MCSHTHFVHANDDKERHTLRSPGFEAETTLNRKDFGLAWNALLETGGVLVGDEVKVTLSLQAAPAA